MRRLAWTAALTLLLPLVADAQDGRATLESLARGLGATSLRSIEYSGSGVNYAVGQSAAPGARWPRFNVKSYTRSVNYESRSLQDVLVRTQAEDPPRGGGGQPMRGEVRQTFVVSGEHAWNVTPQAATPVPIALAERQAQLWTMPHGVVKAALAQQATVQGGHVAFTVPGRLTVKAAVDDQGLIGKVEAVYPHPVVGDMTLEVVYADYRDFGGVKFPTRIRQTIGGHPALDLTVTDVKPNVTVDVPVPDGVRQATDVYQRVATQMVADGVWYVTGGSHHSVAIEMKDHLVVVEGPLNDVRALAVIAEVRDLAPGKPIRYVVNSHHHFDHSGGLRAYAGEGITILTHESGRAYFERTLAAPATLRPDHLGKSGRKPVVEGVRDRRVLTDGTRTVEIHHVAGNGHAEDLLLVYLPKEKLLSQADAFNPPPSGTAPPMPPSPATVHLAETIKRLNLAVDRVLPLHGYIFPIADLHRAAGHTH